jgi:glycosyltransferase involved in cell wall biosynthesis
VKIHLFNQSVGPLFLELAIDIAKKIGAGVVLYSGLSKELKDIGTSRAFEFKPMATYVKSSKFSRMKTWLYFTAQCFSKMASIPKTDLVIIVSNPPLVLVPAMIFSAIRGMRYCVLVYDIYPDIAVSLRFVSENSFFVKAWRFVNSLAYKRAQAVFTLGIDMAATLDRSFDASRTLLGKVGILPIWVDTDLIKPVPDQQNPLVKDWDLGSKFVVLYSGNMGYSHDIDSILHAAKQLSGIDDIVFVLIGAGAKFHDAVNFVADEKLKNVIVRGLLPESMLKYSMSLSDVALVTLEKGTEHLILPSKTYYYMAAGSAVLAISDTENEISAMILDAQFGVRVRPHSPDQLANSILELYNNRSLLAEMKRNSREYCMRHHSRKEITTEFIRVLNETQILAS